MDTSCKRTLRPPELDGLMLLDLWFQIRMMVPLRRWYATCLFFAFYYQYSFNSLSISLWLTQSLTWCCCRVCRPRRIFAQDGVPVLELVALVLDSLGMLDRIVYTCVYFSSLFSSLLFSSLLFFSLSLSHSLSFSLFYLSRSFSHSFPLSLSHFLLSVSLWGWGMRRVPALTAPQCWWPTTTINLACKCSIA